MNRRNTKRSGENARTADMENTFAENASVSGEAGTLPNMLREDEIEAMISTQPQQPVVPGRKKRRKPNAAHIASNPSVNPAAKKTVMVDGLRVAQSRIHPSVEEEMRQRGIHATPGVPLEALEIPSYETIAKSDGFTIPPVFFPEQFLQTRDSRGSAKTGTSSEASRSSGKQRSTTKKDEAVSQPSHSSNDRKEGRQSSAKPSVNPSAKSSAKSGDETPKRTEKKRSGGSSKAPTASTASTTSTVLPTSGDSREFLLEQQKMLQNMMQEMQRTLIAVQENLRKAASAEQSKEEPERKSERKSERNSERNSERRSERKSTPKSESKPERKSERDSERKPERKPERKSVETEKELSRTAPRSTSERLPASKSAEKPIVKKAATEKKPVKTTRKSLSDSLFAKMGLSDGMLQALEDAQYLTPSPIQTTLIPVAMQGVDVMGQAQTGTGKTAAFAIPILEKIQFDENSFDPQALILLPTRELAVQVKDEFEKLAKYSDLVMVALYGGKPLPPQVEQLRAGVDIVIGTPGRVKDHIARRSLRLDHLKIIVLDEADRMLDIGFRPDIEKILRLAPQSRQTMLLSATIPPPVESLARKYMFEPQMLDCSQRDISNETIEQFYFTVEPSQKFELLEKLLLRENPKQAIIFCRTKRGTDKVGLRLSKLFPDVQTIHGDLQQRRRDNVMKAFRDGKIRYLVATDVIGRGIDVTGISHIINYDIPSYCDDYVHRVGRTGRMGREGVAFTFVAPEEGNELTRIEMRINRLLQRDEIQDVRSVTPILPEELAAEPEIASSKAPNRPRRNRRKSS